MHHALRPVGGLILALGFLLIACSPQKSSTPGASETASTTSPSAATASTQPPGSSQPAAAGLEIPVQIRGGTVTPLNAQFDAKVGETITLRVDSDVAEELHVHSVPEHEFEVLPKVGQVFSFSVAVPGQVAIELHHSGKTVATLIVR
jgi:hypothetical protein